MIRDAAKLGFLGALAYGFGRAFYSLFVLLVATIGIAVLAGAAAAWLWFMTSNGML
jgi:hypothetical protein